MPRIIVRGVGEFEVERGANLLEALRSCGVPIAAGCGGHGLCGMCRVRVVAGELSPPTRREAALLSGLLERGWRLACQATVLGDVEVEVPLRRARVKRRLRPSIPISTPLLLIPVRVVENPPSVEEALISELRRLGVNVRTASLRALASMAAAASRGGSDKIAVIMDGELVDLIDDYRGFGLAVDIGTTSVAASLVDLASGNVVGEEVSLNAQLRFGGDIIARIQYAATRANGVRELQEAVVDTVNSLVEKLGVSSERIYRVVVAGNSVMLHLFYGVNPRTLGSLPFEPVYRRSISARSGELGLRVNPQALVESLPILGGYVGGDVVGDMLASRILEYGTAMMIDVGTNGEVVVKKGDRLVAASTPAGPAFEGVGLSHGMMAVEGAVERVKVSWEGVEYRVIGGGDPQGICGSGYIDLLAELLRMGLLSESGKMVRGPRVREREGVLEFVLDEERGVALTQLDVRKLQLAIAAVKMTEKYLLRLLNVDVRELETVIVAGDFGYHLDPSNAMEVGLLPKVNEDLVEFIGNGSLTGAEMFMLSREAREEALRLAEACEVVEVPRHNKAFIEELKLGKWREP